MDVPLSQCPAFEIPVSDEAEESPSAAAATGDGVSPPPPHSCTKVKCMFSVDFNATSDNQGRNISFTLELHETALTGFPSTSKFLIMHCRGLLIGLIVNC